MIRLRPVVLVILGGVLAASCRPSATPPPATVDLTKTVSLSTASPAPSPTPAPPQTSELPSAPTATTAAAPATLGADLITSPPAATVPPVPTPIVTPSPQACLETGRIEHGTVESAIAGEPMRYRIYLPPCYGQDGRVYPALYMFGGNIHDDSIWDSLGLDEAAEAAIIAGDIPPLLIVMPDNGWLANTTTSGPNSYEGFVLNELIPHVETTYCTWPERDGRAVGGLSRGGYWSLMMAFRRPDLFRSVGAHSPALIDSHAGPAEDPAITGGTTDLNDLRIWVDIGERDPYLNDARPLHDTLTAAGVTHEWRVNPGTHEEAYWRENLPQYLAWYSDGWSSPREGFPPCTIP